MLALSLQDGVKQLVEAYGADKVVKEALKPKMIKVVTCGEHVYGLAIKKGLTRAKQEKMMVIGLGAHNRLLYTEVVAVGKPNTVGSTPAEIFRKAIVKGASGIIVVHNHPSGGTKPSSEDVSFTERMRESGEVLGIQVVDSLVVSHLGYTSLRFGDTSGPGCYRELEEIKVA